MSVVIPLFNRWDVTTLCLDALARTVDLTVTQVVAVDNGSTDPTPTELPARYPWVEYHRNDVNTGFAHAVNQGLALAREAVTVLLNNDIEATDGWLEPLLAAVADPAVGLAGPLLLYPGGDLVQHAGVLCYDQRLPTADHAGGLHRWRRRPLRDVPQALRRRTLQAVTGAVMAARTAELRRLGGLDEAYWNGNEDLDLCLRMGAAGLAVVYEPASRLVHHESASGPERFARLDDNQRLFTARWRPVLRPDLVLTPHGTRLGPVPGATAPGDPAPHLLVTEWSGPFWGHAPLHAEARALAGRLHAHHGVLAVPRHLGACDVAPGDEPATDALMAALARREAHGRLTGDVHVRIGLDPAGALTPSPVPHVVLASGAQVLAATEPCAPPEPVTEARHRFVAVGPLGPGVHALLRAYVQAFTPDDDVCLVLGATAGPDGAPAAPVVEAMRRIVEAPGMPEVVVVDTADPRGLLQTGTAFVDVAPAGTTPTLLAAAARHGLVVVAGDTAPARELAAEAARHGADGAVLVLPDDDPAALRAALTAVVDGGRRLRATARSLAEALDPARAGGPRPGTDEIWVPTADAARRLAAAGVPATCLVVLPLHPLPDPLPDRPPRPDGPTRVLFHGGVGPSHGLDLALAACAAAFTPDDDVTLVLHLTGPTGGPLPDEVHRHVQALAAAAPVRHVQVAPWHEAPTDLLTRASVLLAPYREDLDGTVVALARALGVPVAGPDGTAATLRLAHGHPDLAAAQASADTPLHAPGIAAGAAARLHALALAHRAAVA